MATSTSPGSPARLPAGRDLIRVTFVTLILLALVVYLFDVLLLFFGAVLVSVILRAPSDWLARRVGIDARIALAIVLVVLCALLGLAFWLVGHTIVEEVRGVWKRLPEIIEQLQARISDVPVVGEAMQKSMDGPTESMVSNGMATISAAFGALTNVALVGFVAVLLAAQPDVYVKGSLHLLPKRHRKRAGELFDELGNVLERWTLGQLCLMVLVGTLTFVGLALAGIEYAGALGLLAGALTFIPFLGSLFAGVVAVLVALAQGADAAIYAAAIYAGVQIVENVAEPFVQQRAVYLAPALLLFAQAVMGALAGPLGIVLATPLAAVAIVMVKRLYVEDTLGDHTVEESG
jgi:predicted PurR-regulated permease PerM